METPISNQTSLDGLYDSEALEVLSTIANVTLVEGINATKTANKTVWANGDLQYTVVIENDTDEDYVAPQFKDILDPLIVLVANSFKVDGTEYAYSYLANTVTATLPTIEGGGSMTITFLVRKA